MWESVEDLGLVGELALSDTTLWALLADMLSAIYELEGVEKEPPDTTGAAANHLLGASKQYQALDDIAPDLKPWLKRAVDAAGQRNRLVHAIALDRCLRCGKAGRFEHKGAPVDRSAAVVKQAAEKLATLTREGVVLASGLSHVINREHVERARHLVQKAATPVQIRIGGTLHWCPDCSGDGRSRTVIQAPAAAVVMRNEEDLRTMFIALGGSVAGPDQPLS